MREARLCFCASLFALAVAGCVEPCQSSRAPAGPEPALEAGIPFDALDADMAHYRCGSMASVANGLRHLGRVRALDALTEYYKRQPGAGIDSQLPVACICRVLFEPPKGGWWPLWGAQASGKKSGYVRGVSYVAGSEAEFPDLPMAFSAGVPFFLEVYTTAQGPHLPVVDEAMKHLVVCATLEFLPNDIPTEGYAEAATKLVRSKEFAGLFTDDPGGPDRDWITEHVLQQAGQRR